ncbi:MAG: nucleoside triphosphate pyrophosphohydrolase [Eubacteriales bacterium]|nr:nucleoside triphosphate pyrophosphohydrolase [Eubacteriales bacterium]MDD4323929.1 nucleoside triphosphate pyrophosphohydrolase [Eubacteriales bacterium]MDD4540600.1 nucleoside triphosphate pyrophosphohydrolase [Eubacteriales bacterium]
MIDPKDKEFQQKDTYDIQDLLGLMIFLRSENGCPWDRAQDHETIQENMLEEAYEAVDAIQMQDEAKLCEELGDVLMQVVFHAQIAEENEAFDFSDVVTGICKKLISRHTHLFGDDCALTAEEGLDTWAKNKKIERNYDKASQMLTDVPRAMPALMRAAKLQKRAAKVGFDWPTPQGARDKMQEELAELEQELSRREEVATPSQDKAVERAIQAEAGDLLFAVVNYLRLNKIEPESALSGCSDNFIRRFQSMEEIAAEEGVDIDSGLSLKILDHYWDEAKRREREEKTE